MEMLQQLSIVVAILGILCGGLWLLKRKGWADDGMGYSNDSRTKVIKR